MDNILLIPQLPLSFMASVLAIQLDIYPHSAETGEVLWPARQAFGYLIGISFAVIFPLIFIAFRVNPIAGFFSTYIWAQPREPDEEPIYVPLSPKLKDFHTHIPGLRRLWEWRRYLSAQSGTSSSNTGMVSSDLQGEKWSSAVETDYPLHRWGLGLRRVFRRKAMEDLDGGNGKQGSEHGGKYDGDDLGQVRNYKQTMAYGAMKETVKEVRGGDDEVQEESKGKLRGAVDGVTERMKASVSRRRVVARVDLEKGDLRQDH
ncbi:hypothetical protein QC764_0019500 [Podospora pseudoanserina]|uniref:Uncharacterized protein n=1 Tax=Podospora pseudoanserina TaxID=2609844 RepID=A0ABR0IPZ5_9PEZI|nr:hypothetical protein QC764_0019500 [Podospora pseudoanserina]